MSTRDDLIAARALIAGGTSLFRLSPINGVMPAAGTIERGVPIILALWTALPRDYNTVLGWIADVQPSDPDIMALFDRAIEAQPS